MAISKVQFDGQTLIDLSADTVTADKLASGYTAHKADGTVITGSLVLPNAYIATKELATHQSANVALCTLPDEVYAHRNDLTFSVSVVNTTPTQLVQYDDYNILATNDPDIPKTGNYQVYGSTMRKNGATAVGVGMVFYPANSTDNSTSLGGNGKIWLNGKILNYKSAGYYLGAGTLKIIVTW